MRRWLPFPIVLVTIQFIASAAGPSTRPSAESKAVEKDGLSVIVSLDDRAIPADEQPEFVVRFKNISNDYINLYDIDAYWDWQIQFTNIDPRAVHPGPWLLRLDKIPFRQPLAHRQVKPGESTDVVINLNDPPFTFDFAYEGAVDKPIAPVRYLSPGTYGIEVKVMLQNPFGAGYHEWTGPATTSPVQSAISKTAAHESETEPTAQRIADYDATIDRVTAQLQPHGLWQNGGFPEIKLPDNAPAENIIAKAVNATSLESKAYRILRVREVDRPQDNMSAALILIGKKYKVVIFYPFGKNGWWSRFYDANVPPPATQPWDHALGKPRGTRSHSVPPARIVWSLIVAVASQQANGGNQSDETD